MPERRREMLNANVEDPELRRRHDDARLDEPS
jgi:hypothetical protein